MTDPSDSVSVARPRYVDFALEVGLGASRSYPVTIRSTAGEARSTLVLPFDESALENRLLSLENALLRSGGTRRVALTEQQRSVQEFGQTLFEALLAEEGQRLYYESQGDASERGHRLRIKLCFDSPELAALPWEFLFDPRLGDFVALSVNTPLVRYIALPQPVEPLRIKLPLRVLGMVASPKGVVALDVAKEQQQIDAALRDLQEDGHLKLDWLGGQTWDALQREIRRNHFNVFHFIGHGGFDPTSDEGLILLADADGAPYRLPATDLAMLLADEPSLRVVVLNSCEGAQGGTRDIFASTASILVRRGVPAVLAMQYAITDQAALAFSRAFYEAVADGEPMEAAVAEGRKAVRLAIPGTLEWATPVLYQRAPDGVLFHPEEVIERDRERPVTVSIAADRTSRLGSGVLESDSALPTVVQPAAGSGRRESRIPLPAKAIAGLVAAAGLILAALFVGGQLRPAPAAAWGTIAGARITELGITLGDYCRQRPAETACDGLPAEQLGLLGNAVAVSVEANGYGGKVLPLIWSIYDHGSRRRVDDPQLVDQPGWPDQGYLPAAGLERDRNELEIWVPQPFDPGEYFVMIELMSDTGSRLASADTEPFAVDLAAGPGTRLAAPGNCLAGFVWREAYAGDTVCVEPRQREQAIADNAAGASRVDPAGAWGPQSCASGYVWRLAREDDLVCVEPWVRDQVEADNEAAPFRVQSGSG
jgi:hypothetical protein